VKTCHSVLASFMKPSNCFAMSSTRLSQFNSDTKKKKEWRPSSTTRGSSSLCNIWTNARVRKRDWLKKLNSAPRPESASELYRPSDRRLSAKLVPISADRGYDMVSVTDPYDRILGSLDQSHYLFFQVAPQLYSRGWVGPVPDPLLPIKSGLRLELNPDLWICSQELWPLDHRGGHNRDYIEK
jgi:hypothetical protein